MNNKIRITIHLCYCTGHEFTDYIELAEQDYSLENIRHYMDIKARSRGFKGIADVLSAEVITTLC